MKVALAETHSKSYYDEYEYKTYSLDVNSVEWVEVTNEEYALLKYAIPDGMVLLVLQPPEVVTNTISSLLKRNEKLKKEDDKRAAEKAEKAAAKAEALRQKKIKQAKALLGIVE